MCYDGHIMSDAFYSYNLNLWHDASVLIGFSISKYLSDFKFII